jgi:hypothetical protein
MAKTSTSPPRVLSSVHSARVEDSLLAFAKLEGEEAGLAGAEAQPHWLATERSTAALLPQNEAQPH